MPVRGKPALIWLRKNMSAECCSRGPALSRSSREERNSSGVLGGIENLDLAAKRLPYQRASARAEFLTCVGHIALARYRRPIECDELLPGECCRLLQRRCRGAPSYRNIGRQGRADIDCNLSCCETRRSEADGQSQTSELKRSLQRSVPLRYSSSPIPVASKSEYDGSGTRINTPRHVSCTNHLFRTVNHSYRAPLRVIPVRNDLVNCGYARGSTKGQSVDAVQPQPTRPGCKKMFREVTSDVGEMLVIRKPTRCPRT